MSQQTFLRPGQLLSVGAHAAEVVKLQRLLNLYPPSNFSDLKADGIFGDRTKARVLEFQRNVQLNPDGIVGPDTAGALALTISDSETVFQDFRKTLAEYGVKIEELMKYDLDAAKTLDSMIPVAAVQGAVVIGLFVIIVAAFFVALIHMTPQAQQAHQDFVRRCQEKINELREALNLPSPMQVLQRTIENIREMTKEFIEMLLREQLKCKMSPEKIAKCAKESAAVTVAVANIQNRLNNLTFVGIRGFRLEDLVAGILASCGALVVALSKLGQCLDCPAIQFL
jgi:hypothetical protein